ncbi:hypothetical protein [Sphingobium sp.]|uniref:hypothetical protein n=1 Tax=Sphingobium sp. TaxID=1912891 RepID=UPI0035C69404
MKPKKFQRHADPATEEMVSSRYAPKIGDKEVLIVSHGVLPLPTTTLAHNADPMTRVGWFKEMFLPSDALDWPLNVAVVRTGDQVILVDAGLGGQFPGFHVQPDGILPRSGRRPLDAGRTQRQGRRRVHLLRYTARRQ